MLKEILILLLFVLSAGNHVNLEIDCRTSRKVFIIMC